MGWAVRSKWPPARGRPGRAQGELGPEEHDSAARTGIDTTVPHSARIWNYWPGGKDNFAVNRAAGDQFSTIYPGIVDIARPTGPSWDV
jgi:S-adenosyl methyltransferase